MIQYLIFIPLLSIPVIGAVSVDFESPNDLIDNFNVGGGTSGTASWQSSIGFDGSGGITNTTASRVHGFALNQGFDGALSSWTSSIFWNPGSNNGGQYTLGVSTSASPLFSGLVPTSVQDTGDVNDVLGSIYTNFAAGSTTGGINIFNGAPGGAPTQESISSGLNIPLNQWYEVALGVNFNGGTSYTVDATIFSVDASGNRVGSVANTSATFTNAALAADSDVYTYFGVHDLNGTLDNFMTTAVPEPSTVLLGGMGLISLLRRRR